MDGPPTPFVEHNAVSLSENRGTQKTESNDEFRVKVRRPSTVATNTSPSASNDGSEFKVKVTRPKIKG